MRETKICFLGILISFFLYHMISQFNPFLLLYINLYSIPVIYLGMRKDDVSPVLLASLAGILEDMSSSLPFGVNALKKIVLIYTVGKISKIISISSIFAYWFLLFFSILFELGLLFLITGFFGLRNFSRNSYELLIFQPLITSAIGSPFFLLFQRLSQKV
ncbi:MAG: rod shape-determining protein MreD [Candidatus Aminicenantia bacterium]